MASSSSSSIMGSVGATASSYDVFLSFRGEDTRNTFTDHLYKALMQQGIRTFRDNEEIRRGEGVKPEIENAIKQSRASIVVLSRNYADSTWCLDELLLIMDRRRDCNHFVLPVFYHVEPSDVKKHRNTYSIQVKAHSSWTDHSVNLWKKALKEVADLAGMVLSGSERKFIEEIVDEIYDKLERKEVCLPINITGMTNRYNDINSLLHGSNAQFLAICGMGGSGKTTLAGYIVNSICRNFDYISILEDIGSRCKEKQDLLALQEKLFGDILVGKKRTIPSVCQGTLKIEDVLQTKKALIVLDDIVDKSQLVALLGTRSINKQSKIIITTGETNIGNWFESTPWSYQEYQMKLLDDNESLELLSLHAFRSKKLMKGYEDYAKRVLLHCNGNPLALEVLGSSLAVENSIEFWESTLSLLGRDMDDGIQHVLIRSYNSLPNDSYRELFLHIACFFVGKDIDYVVKILEDDAESGIKILTNRCLLSVSPNKKLTMHPLLQEMGRKIVYQESPKIPAKRSRVWLNKDSYDVLRNRKGYGTMEGLALDMNMLEEEKHAFNRSKQLSTDALNKMNKLKLLQLNFVKLSGSYNNFSEDLRWMCWVGFHLETIPSDLFMGNLVALDMSYSKLELFEPPEVLQFLKIVNLKDSENLLEIRNMWRIPHLETLVLWNCRCLALVCETIRNLTSLGLLNMTGCEYFFNRYETNMLVREEPSTSGRGVAKKHTISFPRSLHQLFLRDCNLECSDSFPLSFSVQTSLQYLNLGSNLFECLPCYDHLNNLRVLDLSFCAKLKKLQRLPSTLAELYVYYCYSLETITFESPQFTLQEFGYEGCISLSEVEGFIKLVHVAKLEDYQLGHMKWLKKYENQEVSLVGDDELTKGRSSCVQMLYEFGIMSTSLQDIEGLNMEHDYASECSCCSFDVPSSPKNKTLKGLDVTFKYKIIGDGDWAWFCKISTTNGVDLMYNPKVFGKPDPDKVGIWLSYWKIGNTVRSGDKVKVSIVVISSLEVQECGVSLVYAHDKATEETLENDMGRLETVGGKLSDFQLSTGGYYLCRRDFFELMEVDRPTPDWFKNLVGENFTEVRGWRKTGRPMQSNPSFTELKFVRCIMHGPESEEIYNIAEMSKSSRANKTLKFTQSMIEEKLKHYTSSKSIETSKGVYQESVKMSLSNVLTKEAHILSMEAHNQKKPFITNTKKKHGASSSSMEEVLIFAFPGSWETNDWYHDHLFGETDVDLNLFKSLRRIGENKPAKVNPIFLKKFQHLLLSNSNFKLEVDTAVNDGKKILFTGHSYGGAIASFATLWILDEYVKKQGKIFPIGCVTFGSPLIGDRTMSHAVRREKWAGHFTHFVMEHDIVPRIMLAPKSSIQEHLPNVLKFFQQTVVKPSGHKPSKLKKLFKKSSPGEPMDIDPAIGSDESVEFFENVMMNALTAASQVAYELMEPTNSLMEKLSADFVKVSPYRPFGFYVFCNNHSRQLVVENPNAVLQFLFYFLQLPDENQNLADFALRSLNQSFGYNQVQWENLVRLNDLKDDLLTTDNTGGDAVRTDNEIFLEQSASARNCILAAYEAEKRKKDNEKLMDKSMKIDTESKKSKTIQNILEEIRTYKTANPNCDYYEAFKLQNEKEDFEANMNRLELAKIFDETVEMLRRDDLPDEFEGREEWVKVGTKFRQLVEPLDIANYYRHAKGDGYMKYRPKRYKFTQNWFQHANGMDFKDTSESNFVADLEEIKKEVEETKKKTVEEVKKDLESVKKRVKGWASDEKINKSYMDTDGKMKEPKEDVFWGNSLLSMLQAKLP